MIFHAQKSISISVKKVVEYFYLYHVDEYFYRSELATAAAAGQPVPVKQLMTESETNGSIRSRIYYEIASSPNKLR